MNIEELLNDKSKKIKQKTETISSWLLSASMSVNDLIAFAQKAKHPEKATCIEAIEYATKQNPTIANQNVFDFVTKTLANDAPRVKWESARVIGNIAHLFPAKLSKAISNLLANAEHEGTVVRWAAAFALAQIVKLKTKHNKNLLPAVIAICDAEQDNAIKKSMLMLLKKHKNKIAYSII